MGMKIAARTHQGLVRLKNEDACAVDEDAGWAVLADGMGGLLAGEEASRIAVSAAISMLEANPTLLPVDVVEEAHARVLAHAKSQNYLGKMGTTLIVWCSGRNGWSFSYVGDSRVYQLDGTKLVQLSRDHTVAQRMVDEGIIPQEEAHKAPNQNVLTQAIGMPGRIVPGGGGGHSTERILLCSDGLSGLVVPEKMAELMGAASVTEAADELTKAALDCGGRDNITVIVIDLDSTPQQD